MILSISDVLFNSEYTQSWVFRMRNLPLGNNCYGVHVKGFTYVVANWCLRHMCLWSWPSHWSQQVDLPSSSRGVPPLVLVAGLRRSEAGSSASVSVSPCPLAEPSECPWGSGNTHISLQTRLTHIMVYCKCGNERRLSNQLQINLHPISRKDGCLM